MRILVLSDSRAGHVSQSKAITWAFGKRMPMDVETVRCRLRFGMLQLPLSFLINATDSAPLAGLLRLTHDHDPLPSAKPDLIVSAGGGTLYANAILARHYRTQNLFCGRTRRLRPSAFTGILTSDPALLGRGPFLHAPTPVPVDRERLAEAAAAFKRERSATDLRYWSLLVGGPGAGYGYTDTDWITLAESLASVARRCGIRWLVATSRRTGSRGERLLIERSDPDALAGSTLETVGARAVKYPEILAVAERHFCTEDSHMMLSEAIATGRPVVSLTPESFDTAPSNRFFLDQYFRHGWVRRCSIGELSDYMPDDRRPTAEPPSLDALAETLAAWWHTIRR